MAYDMEAMGHNCYPGTTCLVNLLDIHDENILAATEAALTLGKTSELLHKPLSGPFDFACYKDIHRYLFCDLYPWAGQVRDIDLSKRGTVFMPAAQIRHAADVCFARLVSTDLRVLSDHERAVAVADFYNTINLLHPFREGNGRTQRVFFQQWLRAFDYELDFSQADTDLLMMATIHAAQGVMNHLVAFFERTIQ